MYVLEEKKKINGWIDRWMKSWLEQREVRAAIGREERKLKEKKKAEQKSPELFFRQK